MTSFARLATCSLQAQFSTLPQEPMRLSMAVLVSSSELVFFLPNLAAQALPSEVSPTPSHIRLRVFRCPARSEAGLLALAWKLNLKSSQVAMEASNKNSQEALSYHLGPS